MIDSILSTLLSAAPKKDKEEGKGGVGSLLVIGAILFVLFGGLKLLQQPDHVD